jgi:osmotically-inducible protein OsmY
MADTDRWNERRDRERDRSYRMQDLPDYGQTEYSGGYESDYRGEYSYNRPRGDFQRAEDRDDRYRGDNRPRGDSRRYAPFGAAGPVESRDGAFDDHGERYGGYGRNDYRGQGREDQRRYGRADYDDRHGRNFEDRAREAGREARSWWDRTTDKIGSALSGDDNDRRPADRNAGYRAAEHRGRGPKGYRRSDDRIREDINDRLTDDPYLDASEIEVQVVECEVTLTGTVQRRSDKRRAEELAESISGVSHVQNNLRAQNNDRDDDRDWTRGMAWMGPF